MSNQPVRIPRKKKEKKVVEATWMTTFGDVQSLLLIFFITFFSFDSSKPKTFSSDVASLQSVAGPSRGGKTIVNEPLETVGHNNTAFLQSKTSTMHQQQMLTQLLYKEIADQRVSIHQSEKGLLISLPGSIFYSKDSAKINMDQVRTLLQKIVYLLDQSALENYNIRVEGHASVQEAQNPKGVYLNSWQLSAARALSVLYVLKDYGINAKRLSITGYGDTQPNFLGKEKPELDYDQRVDIVILNNATNTIKQGEQQHNLGEISSDIIHKDNLLSEQQN